MFPYAVIAMIVACAASFAAGIWVEGEHRDAQQLAQERAFHDAYKQAAAVSRGIAEQVSKELNDERVARQGDAQAFRAELRDSRATGRALATCPPAAETATAVASVAPGVVEPVTAALRSPEPRFTAEFARLFDFALATAGLSGPGDPGPTHADATATGTVDAETVLSVHAENADAWGECGSIVRGWQSIARKHGWVK